MPVTRGDAGEGAPCWIKKSKRLVLSISLLRSDSNSLSITDRGMPKRGSPGKWHGTRFFFGAISTVTRGGSKKKNLNGSDVNGDVTS